MLSSFWNPACLLHRGRRGCRACLGDQSIVGTLTVSVRHDSSGATLTHDTPSLLVVVYIYLLVKSVQVIVFAPYLRVFELDEGILRDEFTSSQVPAREGLAVCNRRIETAYTRVPSS